MDLLVPRRAHPLDLNPQRVRRSKANATKSALTETVRALLVARGFQSNNFKEVIAKNLSKSNYCPPAFALALAAISAMR